MSAIGLGADPAPGLAQINITVVRAIHNGHDVRFPFDDGTLQSPDRLISALAADADINDLRFDSVLDESRLNKRSKRLLRLHARTDSLRDGISERDNPQRFRRRGDESQHQNNPRDK